ncbi:MAG: U32 family peptidase [Clostridia bacterium]|nr:U32 family peptidase [Clostridia bacterium]
MVEILAPVGGREQLTAALRAGADAVYLGTQAFNARRNAENFTGEGLRDVVEECHHAGVKVHVTFNTLISDGEIAAAEAEMEKIAQSGVDAVIVQDLGVAALFRAHCPGLPLHASTQMAIHNAEGALAAYDLGFRRVVLARELSLAEIRAIRSKIPDDLELEVFIHGALCVSLSGGCYLSGIIGGRSGNRGLCAGPCRLDFTCRGRNYVLSLKDMSHIEHMEELRDAGVASFKIEGRMKGPEYVAAVVHACREKLAGRKPNMDQLQAIFSRSGFTDGYYSGNIGQHMFGIRTREDALNAASAERETGNIVRNVFQKVPLEAKLTLEAGKKAVLTLSDGVNTVAVEGDEPIVPRDAATSEEVVRKNLSKTGGTPYYLETLIFENQGGLMLPPSAQNALRRAALEGLSALRRRVEPWEFDPAPVTLPQRVSRKRQGIWLRAMHPEQLDFDEEAEKILLPGESLTPELAAKYGDRLIATLPEVNFEADSARLTAILQKLQALGVKDVEVWNIGTLHAAKKAGFTLHGGAGLNVYNSLALAEYERLGLADGVISFELSARDIEKLGGTIPRGIIGYGRLPLMRLRACPGKGPKGCGKCQGQTTLTDRIGAEFRVSCDGRRYSTLYNTLPLYVGDKEPGGIDYAVLSFTFESAEEAERIYRKYLGGYPPRVERTRGLYYRETK